MMTRQKTYRILATVFALLLSLRAGADAPRRVVFLGDSLTAGYTLDADLAYPALIQKKIDAEAWPFQVVNSGISGDTTAGGLRRLDWLMRRPIDLLVIALGANDGLRGFPPGEAERNLAAMIERVRETSPGTIILLAGMRLPENMGEAYIRDFEAIYGRLAERYAVPLKPFLLEGVAGDPALNLPDGIHPNQEGQAIIADAMWQFIRPHLEALSP
ncbi:MAG TPA: arylesterase [Kiritimatiellia bacterium]|nr:arylesterase [Kiritimatiellia bacterium]HMO97703.1 arylesterase [Kiritimatiellia bacterium]HMP97967.1 arylesterase [Kiritimatiellia bacterium]